MKNINVQTLKVKEEEFFTVWLMVLQPFLKLRKQEVAFLSKLLYYRYLISKDVKNKTLIEDLLFNVKTKNQIKKELNMKSSAFNNLLNILRKRGIITNNSINSKIIPKVEPEFKMFKLVFSIEII